MHDLLDYDGYLPAYVHISDGKTANNKGAYEVPLLKNSVIVADRFYDDFSLLHVWDSSEVFFVVRHKDYRTLSESALPENRHQHKLIVETIELTGPQTSKHYPRKYHRPWSNMGGIYPIWLYSFV